jgi:O-antigen/teichoic acid export membrane protein
MSRARRFVQSLATGYLLIGVNTIHTLVSVPLALHYLSREQFGLWALVMQISGYLALIDLGMAGSIARILIDHKDSAADGTYGAVIKTGLLVLLVQGLIIALGGSLLSLWLPDLFDVPTLHRREFQILIAGQCIVMGLLFVGRMFGHVLLAHQRFDAMNYSQAAGLLVSLTSMWLGFVWGWGVYSLLFAYAASTLFTTLASQLAAIGLRLFPAGATRGHPNVKIFRELFAYGREIFLISVGWQLVNASQILVVSRTLGLEAVAVWSIATKPFSLAQQVIYRVFDFSAIGLAEMLVRRERERLLLRFRDIVILSGSFAAWVALSVGLWNQSFLDLWTRGRISWADSSNWLMALLTVSYSITRCSIGFVDVTKQICSMKYIYPLEGLAFILLSFAVAPFLGLSGVILSALITNILFSGAYGFWRTSKFFGTTEFETAALWLSRPIQCLSLLVVTFGAIAWVCREWRPSVRLPLEMAASLSLGVQIFWRLGLTPQLRSEAKQLLARIRARP